MRKLIFEKFAGNPVLTASQFPADIMYVMNPSCRCGDDFDAHRILDSPKP